MDVFTAKGDINARVATSDIIPGRARGPGDLSWCPMHWAVLRGQLELLPAFAARSDIDITRVEKGAAFVTFAALVGLQELTAVLTAFPHASVDPQPGEEGTPLEVAMYRDDPDSVGLLLARGANIHMMKSTDRFNELQQRDIYEAVFKRYKATSGCD